jgi:hypothetical protein
MGKTYSVERLVVLGVPDDRWVIEMLGKRIMIFESHQKLEADNFCDLLNQAYDSGFECGFSAIEQCKEEHRG